MTIINALRNAKTEEQIALVMFALTQMSKSAARFIKDYDDVIELLKDEGKFTEDDAVEFCNEIIEGMQGASEDKKKRVAEWKAQGLDVDIEELKYRKSLEKDLTLPGAAILGLVKDMSDFIDDKDK